MGNGSGQLGLGTLDKRLTPIDVLASVDSLLTSSFSPEVGLIPYEEQARQQDSPALGMDGSGNLYALWVDYRNGNAYIYFAYRPAGGNWGANVKVNDDAGRAPQTNPAIAVDDSGNAFAVWQVAPTAPDFI